MYETVFFHVSNIRMSSLSWTCEYSSLPKEHCIETPWRLTLSVRRITFEVFSLLEDLFPLLRVFSPIMRFFPLFFSPVKKKLPARIRCLKTRDFYTCLEETIFSARTNSHDEERVKKYCWLVRVHPCSYYHTYRIIKICKLASQTILQLSSRCP